MFLAAAVQLTCTSDRARNDAAVDTLVRRAARYGATLVCTPENTNFLGPHEEKVRTAEPLGGPTVTRYRDLARELGITLLIGSVNEAAPTPGKCFNTSVLIGPDGKIITFYRKIHLFDVDVSDDVRFMESDTVERGHELVVAATPHGMIGMSVC